MSLAKNKKVFVYSFDSLSNETIFYKSFNSCSDAAKELNTSNSTISKYIDKGRLFKKKWLLFSNAISSN